MLSLGDVILFYILGGECHTTVPLTISLNSIFLFFLLSLYFPWKESCVRAVCLWAEVCGRVENFWWHTRHTECRQLCSRCRPQNHVWIPFVVFMDGGHQKPLSFNTADQWTRWPPGSDSDQSMSRPHSVQTIKTFKGDRGSDGTPHSAERL